MQAFLGSFWCTDLNNSSILSLGDTRARPNGACVASRDAHFCLMQTLPVSASGALYQRCSNQVPSQIVWNSSVWFWPETAIRTGSSRPAPVTVLGGAPTGKAVTKLPISDPFRSLRRGRKPMGAKLAGPSAHGSMGKKPARGTLAFAVTFIAALPTAAARLKGKPRPPP